MAGVVFEGASKRYGDVVALHPLELEVEDGELVVLVGPSGSGKTTALRLLAGLESLSSGHIRIGDKRVDQAPARDRDIAMVFQDYALYPQMSVYKNLAFGLRMRKAPPEQVERLIREAAGILGLEELLDRKPRQLSGGQRQRVALGRALVRRPQVWLMDEPLSNLDAKLRVHTRVEIARIQKQFATTTVYVTHDQTEALTLGHRVAVMRDGTLQQLDSPTELYRNPANLFVAGFIGSPAMNLTEAWVQRADDAVYATFGDHNLLLGDDLLDARSGLAGYEDRKVILGVRPEGLSDARGSDVPPERRLSVIVELREDVGSDVYAYFKGGPPVRSEAASDLDAGAGSRDSATRFIARLPAGTRLHEGAPVELVPDPARLHFFDPDSGDAIAG